MATIPEQNAERGQDWAVPSKSGVGREGTDLPIRVKIIGGDMWDVQALFLVECF